MLQVDVATVIQTVQPDIVVLELCKERTNILHLDEETVLEEAKNLTMDKMMLAIKQNGTVQVNLRVSKRIFSLGIKRLTSKYDNIFQY